MPRKGRGAHSPAIRRGGGGGGKRRLVGEFLGNSVSWFPGPLFWKKRRVYQTLFSRASPRPHNLSGALERRKKQYFENRVRFCRARPRRAWLRLKVGLVEHFYALDGERREKRAPRLQSATAHLCAYSARARRGASDRGGGRRTGFGSRAIAGRKRGFVDSCDTSVHTAVAAPRRRHTRCGRRASEARPRGTAR